MEFEEEGVSRRNMMGVGALGLAGLAAMLPAVADAAPAQGREAAIQDMLDKAAIREVLNTYPRGLDRLDHDLLLSIGWPDGTVRFIDGKTYNSWKEFMDWLHQVHTDMMFNNHRITNNLIVVKGNKAASETSATATLLRRQPDGGVQESYQHTRYMDNFEKRNGVWKIIHRHVNSDYRRVTNMTEADYKARYQIAARQGKEDQSYKMFGSL